MKQFTVAIKKFLSTNSLRFKPNLKLFKKFEKAETGNCSVWAKISQTGNRKLGFGLVQTEFESVSNQTSPTLVLTLNFKLISR